MSQSDYRVVTFPEPIKVHHDDHKAKLLGALLDRRMETKEEIMIWAVIAAEVGKPLSLNNPAYWLVDDESRVSSGDKA